MVSGNGTSGKGFSCPLRDLLTFVVPGENWLTYLVLLDVEKAVTGVQTLPKVLPANSKSQRPNPNKIPKPNSQYLSA